MGGGGHEGWVGPEEGRGDGGRRNGLNFWEKWLRWVSTRAAQRKLRMNYIEARGGRPHPTSRY